MATAALLGTKDDLTNKRFAHLVALGPMRVAVYARTRAVIWECLCDCGKTTEVRDSNLRSGHTKSCGCFGREVTRTAKIKHGHAHAGKPTPEYRLWANIKKRCLVPTSKSYKDYGGRGILMDKTWQGDFQAFLADVGLRPSSAHSIDRVDVNGHYEPGNVRWATRLEQQNNTRSNRRLEIGSETKTVTEWSRVSGIPPDTIYERLKLGWANSDAVFLPKRVAATLTFRGETKTLDEWSIATGVNKGTISYRMRRGLPAEQVLSRNRPPSTRVAQ